MSVKPFSQIVSNTKEKLQEPIKPFVDQAHGGKEVQDLTVKKTITREKKSFFLQSLYFLSSFTGVVSILIAFLFVVIFVNALQTIEASVVRGSPLDILYLVALITLLVSLTLTSYKNYIQIKNLKNVQKIQELFAQQKQEPSKEIVSLTLQLLHNYTTSSHVKLQQKAQLLQTRIENSHDYKEIYKELDEVVINEIDLQVQAKIKSASIQAAISTAISPLAVVDAGIVVWRSFRLTKEIAQLYGYKPGVFSTLLLLKKGAFNIFFAGATELAIEYTNDLAQRSIVSKISTSAAQGLSNGILLARLGFGVMQACRPLPMRIKRESFVKGIYRSIKEFLSSSKEK